MKFVYIDETGDSSQLDIFVMIAMEIDHTKLNKYTRIFGTEFQQLFALHDGKPDDFKTKKFHRGGGGWSVVPGNERKEFISKIVRYISECSKLYIHPVSLNKLKETVENIDALPEYTHKYWIPSALFILSHIQRDHCDDKNNKGNCIIIVDDNKKEHANMAKLIYKPDPWLDYISFKKVMLEKNRRPKNWKHLRFNQIVNTPFAIKSEHASMIQVADLVAFVVRRYLELKTTEPAFQGENIFFQDLFENLKPLIKKHSNLKKDTKAYNYYKSIQPDDWEFSLK